MKKFIALILSAVIMMTTVIPAFAGTSQVQTEYLPDGSYYTVEFRTSDRFMGALNGKDDDLMMSEGMSSFELLYNFFRKLVLFLTRQKTVTKEKYINYYDMNGKYLWGFKFVADFIYGNKKAVCSEAYLHYDYNDRNWAVENISCTKEGNAATAYFAVRQYSLQVPLKLVERTVTMTCDENGNVT